MGKRRGGFCCFLVSMDIVQAENTHSFVTVVTAVNPSWVEGLYAPQWKIKWRVFILLSTIALIRSLFSQLPLLFQGRLRWCNFSVLPIERCSEATTGSTILRQTAAAAAASWNIQHPSTPLTERQRGRVWRTWTPTSFLLLCNTHIHTHASLLLSNCKIKQKALKSGRERLRGEKESSQVPQSTPVCLPPCLVPPQLSLYHLWTCEHLWLLLLRQPTNQRWLMGAGLAVP